MSFAMNLENVMSYLFRPHKENEKSRKNAMVFSFDVSMTSYSGPQAIKSYSRRQSVHFLLYSPWGGSVYTYFASGDAFDRGIKIPPERWINISNHDSCWLDALRGKLFEVYMGMADSINLDREADGLEREAPARMHQMSHVTGLLKPMYELAEVTQDRDIAKDMDDSFCSGYWKILTSIKKVPDEQPIKIAV